MRFKLLFAFVLIASVAHAKPAEAPLPTQKAEPILVGRAVLAKDLPTHISAPDRKQLDASVAELKADHLEGGLSIYRRWCDGSVKPLSREELIGTALWTFHEGALSSHEALASAADRLRFDDERDAAIDDSLALMNSAAIAKKPVLVARIVVLTPYTREARGDEKRERQISRDALSAELPVLEKASAEAKTERARARSAYDAIAAKNSRLLQTLAGLDAAAEAAKLPNSGHFGG